MNEALVIIDAQRGFMPAEEGERLDRLGFGELPVAGGEKVVPCLNELTLAFRNRDLAIVTTQDMHPDKTAHFSDTPNFVDSWPPHCRKDTPGAAFHPELLAGGNVAAHFIKGDVAAATPAEDNSYTGALAHRYYPLSDRDVLLPEYLRNEGVDVVYLGGLALGDGKDHPLCVDSTAIDLKQAGFKVIVITDAVEAVNPDNREICFANLGAIGVQLATTSEIIADIR